MKHDRHQTGYLYETADKFYVRYRRVEIVNGAPQRVQRSEFLCDKDKRHRTATDRAVKIKRDEFMLRINLRSSSRHDVSVTEFWTGVYLPFAVKNLRASTVSGYTQTWNQHLGPHFGTVAMREYTTGLASRFLTGLAEKYSRRTLAHIRTTASAVFSHALNLEYVGANPWHGAKVLGKIRDTEGTAHYTLEEAENLINALVDRTDAQLVMALAFYEGLRPSEIVALQWGDFDDTHVHIRRASVHGVMGDTKTPESKAALPVIRPVRLLLEAWRLQCPASKDGWVFPAVGARAVAVMDIRNFAANVMRPIVTAKLGTAAWKGLYAARRGAGTVLVELTGNLVAAQELLRHKSQVTTGLHYAKLTKTGLSSGMRLLESTVALPPPKR
jgi:integrase